MRIGVTGGAGYIGSHVVQDLLAAGHAIVVLDNFSSGNRANIFTGTPGYECIEGDVLAPADLAQFLDRGLDAVFHFAASKAAGESMTDPGLYCRNNIRGTLQLLEAMLERGVLRFVFSSSAAVYGEPQYLPIDEKHPLQPINYYGFTKLVIEQNLQWFSQLKGMRYAALRYFNAAGYDVHGRVTGLELTTANLCPIIMEVATGKRANLGVFGRDYATEDGTAVRDYIHVSDLSRAHVLAFDRIMAQDENVVVNLGSERGSSVQEVLDAARKATGQPIPSEDHPRRAGDPPRLVASAGLARELLGWRAEASDLDTILSSMWRIYSQA